MTVSPPTEKYWRQHSMSWLFCGSDVNSFMLLFRRFSIDQSHAASLMVSTQRSTTIPVYIIKSLQNSGIRFSWVWAFAAGFTIKSSAMFLDLLSIQLFSSGILKNPSYRVHGVSSDFKNPNNRGHDWVIGRTHSISMCRLPAYPDLISKVWATQLMSCPATRETRKRQWSLVWELPATIYHLWLD